MCWMINKEKRKMASETSTYKRCTACKYVVRFLCVFRSECNAKNQTGPSLDRLSGDTRCPHRSFCLGLNDLDKGPGGVPWARILYQSKATPTGLNLANLAAAASPKHPKCTSLLLEF